MLYWLTELTPEFAALNIFRYITFRTGGALITALLFVFLFGPRVIRSLRVRQGKGQPAEVGVGEAFQVTQVGAEAGRPPIPGILWLRPQDDTTTRRACERGARL